MFRDTFNSALVSAQGSRTKPGGHFDESLSHSVPCFHSWLSVTFSPRLPKSAGFSVVGT